MSDDASGGVALIYPYFREKDPVQKLFPPLGIAYLAGQLHEIGVPVTVHDCTFETFSGVVEKVVTDNPQIVGIYAMITMSRNAFALLDELRIGLPDTLFAAGGPLPTVYPDRFARRFDLVFRGEADRVFPQFCHEYISKKSTPDDLSRLDVGRYPGVYLHSGNGVVQRPPIHHPAAVLDRLPLPDRSGFRHDLYQQYWYEAERCRPASIIITRGCPYACDFCSKPIWGNVFRKPSLERVFSEIEQIIALGYDRVWIADDCFTLDSGLLVDFCTEMIERGVPITWTCLSRVDRLDSGIVMLMQKAGCVRVYLGLESGSNETLSLMGKRASVQEGIRAVHLFHDAGIETAGFFIVGYPGETRESVEETLSLALTLPLDEISFNVPFPLPGSALHSRVADLNVDADWESANEVRFVYRSEFEEKWLRDRIARTVGEFKKRLQGRSCSASCGEGTG
jgi:anaerobic magnesium-protoporphyrin IX monomethyl ester cyclase